MNYVFDVCLNFNKELYNFYEWNNEDEILYFLKIPVFKIEEEIINDFIKNDIRVDILFLNKIYNKSQIYFKKSNKINEYSCILTTDKQSVGLNFDKNGYVIGKSYLSLEEENEVTEFSKFIKYSLINYKIIKQNSVRENYLTRKEKEDIKIIKNYLNIFEKDGKNNELKYLYYEVFNTNENDYKKIKNKLDNILFVNDKKRDKILEIIKKVC